MTPLDRPLVIVGAARSGTSMTSRVLQRHPDVAFWMEPKYVWKVGRPLAPDDRRDASEATPAVRRYIRRSFARYAGRAGKPRFMEKTPSNCFRVGFVHAVLPEARFLHVVRDGRAVTRSALRMWTKTPDKRALKRRLSNLEVPLRDAPFYAAAVLRDVVGRQLFPSKAFVWGPQFPGIREVRDEKGVVAACAVQWRESVAAALDGLATVPAEQQMTVRFEDVMASPETVMAQILDFFELPPSAEVRDYARTFVDEGNGTPYDDDLDPVEIDPYLEPLLSDLGYG
ncbi:sulfotransferase family protein [Rubrivirga sp.]|uniref:sulfotransferase family protein n=1 Tax=Rubrivirga sp. TaxID=1885344 RepID=UPI003B51916B